VVKILLVLFYFITKSFNTCSEFPLVFESKMIEIAARTPSWKFS